MSEWQIQTLDSAGIEFIDGDRGKNYPSQDDFQDIGHCLFLSTKNVRSNGFDFGDCQFISTEKDELLRKGKLNRGDIVLTTRGTVGNTALYDESVKFDHVRINSGMVIIRMNPTNVDSSFFLYFLRQLDYTSFVSGSAQPQLPIRDLKQIEIALPPLPEQKAIASVLSSLDDKIDLLHRQNKTLEAMAETLFRQWFIEEAKEDWEDGTLDQLIDLKYGKALKQEDRSGSGYPVVASSGIVGYHKEYLIDGPGIVIGRKGTLGKVYFMEEHFYPIDTSYYIQTKVPQSNLIFEYFLLKAQDFANMNSDSAVPGLNRTMALSTEIQIPPKVRIMEFNEIAKPWFEKMQTNAKQIQTLEKLRDTLLPKLMSGEVRVQYEASTV